MQSRSRFKGSVRPDPENEEQCIVTCTSMFSRQVNDMTLPISFLKFQEGIQRWNEGHNIEHAFPGLNADQREFLKTGITPKEWDDEFKEK